MKATIAVVSLLAALGPAMAQSSKQEPTKPVAVMQQVVTGMPKGEQQEIRIFTATFAPGQATVHHTHRFPVTVYILEGTFTLEMEGKPPVAVKAGESIVEPPNIPVTGYNRSNTEPIKLVIFYVSDPDTPFLDVIAHK